MALRDILRSARRDLHQVMQVPALYLAAGLDPLPVSVRLLTEKPKAVGDLAGSRIHYAQTEETTPKILFMRDEVDRPLRNAVVSVEPGEAYRIDFIYPSDDITVSASVVRLDAADCAGLPIPEAVA